MAQNSWFSLLGCTQASGQAGGTGLGVSSSLEAKLLPRLLHSPDPVGLCVSDLALCGPTSPSTHSVSVLSPKLGAPSSVTVHVPRSRAQSRRTVFPKEGGGRWGSSLLFHKEQEELGFVTVTVSPEGSVVELSKPMDQNSCQALGRTQGGQGLDPHQQQRVFYLPKVFPFPCWEEKHSTEKCLCSFPCPHLEVLADFHFCFLKDSNFFFLLPIKIKIKKILKKKVAIFFL